MATTREIARPLLFLASDEAHWMTGQTVNVDGGMVCPADVQMCPNGGFVSRTGPNCTFPACPGSNVDGGSALQCGPGTVCPMGLTCLATGFCGTPTTCGPACHAVDANAFGDPTAPTNRAA